MNNPQKQHKALPGDVSGLTPEIIANWFAAHGQTFDAIENAGSIGQEEDAWASVLAQKVGREVVDVLNESIILHTLGVVPMTSSQDVGDVVDQFDRMMARGARLNLIGRQYYLPK